MSGSPEETRRIGETIGRELRGGEVLGIRGDLGAGKTCLVRGIARGLDIDPDVIYSPSFTLIAEHQGRLPLYHIDLFRLGQPVSEREEIGLEDYLEPQGVTAIEWFEKLGGESVSALGIDIAIEGPESRRIRVAAQGPRGEEIVQSLATAREGG